MSKIYTEEDLKNMSITELKAIARKMRLFSPEILSKMQDNSLDRKSLSSAIKRLSEKRDNAFNKRLSMVQRLDVNSESVEEDLKKLNIIELRMFIRENKLDVAVPINPTKAALVKLIIDNLHHRSQYSMTSKRPSESIDASRSVRPRQQDQDPEEVIEISDDEEEEEAPVGLIQEQNVIEISDDEEDDQSESDEESSGSDEEVEVADEELQVPEQPIVQERDEDDERDMELNLQIEQELAFQREQDARLERLRRLLKLMDLGRYYEEDRNLEEKANMSRLRTFLLDERQRKRQLREDRRMDLELQIEKELQMKREREAKIKKMINMLDNQRAYEEHLDVMDEGFKHQIKSYKEEAVQLLREASKLEKDARLIIEEAKEVERQALQLSDQEKVSKIEEESDILEEASLILQAVAQKIDAAVRTFKTIGMIKYVDKYEQAANGLRQEVVRLREGASRLLEDASNIRREMESVEEEQQMDDIPEVIPEPRDEEMLSIVGVDEIQSLEDQLRDIHQQHQEEGSDNLENIRKAIRKCLGLMG